MTTATPSRQQANLAARVNARKAEQFDRYVALIAQDGDLTDDEASELFDLATALSRTPDQTIEDQRIVRQYFEAMRNLQHCEEARQRCDAATARANEIAPQVRNAERELERLQAEWSNYQGQATAESMKHGKRYEHNGRRNRLREQHPDLITTLERIRNIDPANH